jgi:hypothetical protein
MLTLSHCTQRGRLPTSVGPPEAFDSVGLPISTPEGAESSMALIRIFLSNKQDCLAVIPRFGLDRREAMRTEESARAAEY